MKYTRIVLMMILALALVNVLPVIAQDEKPVVEYVFNGTELQRIENGVIVQAWSLTNTLETQQIAGILQARAQSDDPTIRYEFDHDRMYHLRDNQVVGMSELRGGSWVEEPALMVSYNYDGFTARRFVNGRLQHTWTFIGEYQWVASMQAEANKLVAAHVDEELHVEPMIEHLPTLLAENFTLHYKPAIGEAPELAWYTPEFGETLASVLAVKTDDPVVMAMENLVVVREPALDYSTLDLMNLPEFSFRSPVDLFDVYRFQDGKVTDIWLGLDLATLVQTAN